MDKKSKPRTLLIRDRRQRKVLTSPIRLEILGHFTSSDPLSVSDLAEQMGRPATAVYYHVHELERVGLIERAGSRPSGKRKESLFRPVAEQYDLTPDRTNPEQVEDTLTTMGAAHSMVIRDMEASLKNDTGRFEGPDRNFIALRVHGRLSRKSLAKANKHIDALLELFLEKPQTPETTETEFISLTAALLPLRGRQESE